MTEASTKAEADKIREKDLEQRKTLGEDDMDVEEAGSEKSLKGRELELRRQAYAKVDENGKPTIAVRQKAFEIEADEIKSASGQEKKGSTILQRRPKTQQQPSRSPPGKKRKTETHQHCQLELGEPDNQGCSRIRNAYSGGYAMGHHLLQEVFRKTEKLDCGANCVLFNAPKMLAALRAPPWS